MYRRVHINAAWRRVAGLAAVVVMGAGSASAQGVGPSRSSEEPSNGTVQTSPAQGDEHAGHSVSQDEHAAHQTSEAERQGSGTGWLPIESPMYAVHAQNGGWELMFHESAFFQYLHESGGRGDDQAGSINWMMGMAQRDVGSGRLGVRAMFSIEPWTIRGCGYPDLLASGETCEGEAIHDRQHPHDLFMELAAEYNAPLVGGVRWQLYGGPAGEPALGPVAYPHRTSAMPNPLAPIAHHWIDSTHVTFGVLTGALYSTRWKAETSIFNGREPDEDRATVDVAALDSVSGRLTFLPTRRLALQVSVGHVNDAETEENGTRLDVTRTTASLTYHVAFRPESVWASTVAWGRNSEAGDASQALLVETSLTVDERDSWFGRFEIVGKSAHDLVVGDDAARFTVAKLQGGYTRYARPVGGFKPGVGAGLSVGVVPERLKSIYGSRTNVGVAVFLTLRPMAHGM